MDDWGSMKLLHSFADIGDDLSSFFFWKLPLFPPPFVDITFSYVLHHQIDVSFIAENIIKGDNVFMFGLEMDLNLS